MSYHISRLFLVIMLLSLSSLGWVESDLHTFTNWHSKGIHGTANISKSVYVLNDYTFPFLPQEDARLLFRDCNIVGSDLCSSQWKKKLPGDKKASNNRGRLKAADNADLYLKNPPAQWEHKACN